jgi:hypothetical protein
MKLNNTLSARPDPKSNPRFHDNHPDPATRLSKHVMNTSEQDKSCNEQNNSCLCASLAASRGMPANISFTVLWHKWGWRQWSDRHVKLWPKYSFDFFNGGIYIYIKIVSILIIKEVVVGDGVPAVHQSWLLDRIQWLKFAINLDRRIVFNG